MMGAMTRRILLVLLTMLLASCASGGDRLSRRGMPDAAAGGRVAASDQLAAQTLLAGACAAFFWSRDGQQRFLVFDNETAGLSRIFVDGQTEDFVTPAQRGGYISGDPYRRAWTDPARQLDISLTGVMGESQPTGLQIDRAVLRLRQSDGRELVIPVAGQYVCRGAPQIAGSRPGP
jgi:hypothetical protein